jgi:hypothetical protein
MAPLLLTGLFSVGEKLIDKFFTSDEEKAAAKIKLLQAAQKGELDVLQTQLSAIVAEAQSSDPYTSRARPTFLYVIYIYLLCAIPMGVLYAFKPEAAAAVAQGVNAWLDAIPEPLYALFGAGYLGYTAFRSWDKRGGK